MGPVGKGALLSGKERGNAAGTTSGKPVPSGVAPIVVHGATMDTGTARSRVFGSAYSCGAVARWTALRTFGTAIVSVPAPTTGQTQVAINLAVLDATIDASMTYPLLVSYEVGQF
jgi:hypothetical protein